MYYIKRRLGITKTSAVLFIALFFILIFSLPAFASEGWSVFQHDTRHSGQSGNIGIEKPDILWLVQFGETGKPSTPIAVSSDGNLYLGVDVTPAAESTETKTKSSEKESQKKQSDSGHSGVFAFDSRKNLLWVSQASGKVSGPLATGEDGTVYAVVGMDLVALNKKNGKTKWKMTLNGESTGGVMIDKNGIVYATTLEGKSLYAVSSDGKLKWIYAGEGQIDSSPAIGSDGTIYYTAKDLYLYAIDPNGSLKWKYRAPYELTDSISAPVLAVDDTIYFSGSRYEGDDGHECLYAVNPDGKSKWVHELEGKKATMPAVAKDGTIILGTTTLNYTVDTNFVMGDCYIHATDPNGNLKWSFKSRDNEMIGAPVIESKGKIYLNSSDGSLYIMTKKGFLKWRAKVGGKVSIGSNGVFYVAAKSSIAALIDKETKEDLEQEKQVDELSHNGSSSGEGFLSLLIYVIPVAIALGMGFFFKSVLSSRSKEQEEEQEEEQE